MEKKKSKATGAYRGKASDYRLDCACSLSICKTKQASRQRSKAGIQHHQKNK